jgi:hypothetical protein
MTSPVLVKITSATFKGKQLLGAQSASIQVQGSEQSSRGDGAIARQASYVEDVHVKVTVAALQGLITDTDAYLPGNGALVITGFTQADGAGSAGGGAHSWTFPNATLVNAGRTVPLDGNPGVSFDWTAVAASGLIGDLFSMS